MYFNINIKMCIKVLLLTSIIYYLVDSKNISENIHNITHKDKIEHVSHTIKSNLNGEKSIPKNSVTLTMKQGLIMNQIISTYGISQVKNTLCKNHIEEFKLGMRSLEPWALQMFDSSSKLPSGILNGNLVEYGAYTQCLNIYVNTNSGPIRGRHCGIRVKPTDELLQIILAYRNVSKKRFKILKNHVMEGVQLVWSVCVPDSCDYKDVFPHFNRSISELSVGLNLTVSLEEQHCVALKDYPEMETGDYLFIFFVVTVIIVVCVASTIDYIKHGECGSIMSVFSVFSNGKRLFSVEHKSGELECLHGLRFISICYVVTGHRYLQNMFFPTSNAIDLIYWIQNYFTTVVIGGTISVDTFFLIGSTLVSYNFFQYVEKTNSFNLFYFYLYRMIRITVPLAVMVAFYSTVLKYLGSGLAWVEYSHHYEKTCRVFWWSTILHLQSYINPKTLCIIQIWYLTNDMVFYFFSPIIMLPLWKYPKFGLVNWLFIYILSLISSFSVAWINQFDGAMPITPLLPQTRYFQEHYITPHTRASPYLLGLAFGYALFKTQYKRVYVGGTIRILGWIYCAFALTSVVVISHIFHMDNYEYNRFFSSFYLAFSRSVWTSGVMWVIFCCINGYGGVINLILSHSAFKILGRLTYSILLLHFFFQSGMQAAAKTPQYFSDFIALYMSSADIVFMALLGIPFVLCFEYPSIGVAALIMRGTTKKIKPTKS